MGFRIEEIEKLYWNRSLVKILLKEPRYYEPFSVVEREWGAPAIKLNGELSELHGSIKHIREMAGYLSSFGKSADTLVNISVSPFRDTGEICYKVDAKNIKSISYLDNGKEIFLS